MKKIVLIKNRSDIGAGTRGSDLGIDALEIAAINQNDSFFQDLEHIDVETHNESIYNKVKNRFGKRIVHVVEQCERLSEVVKETLDLGAFPLVISGDHSSALGTISGIKAANPSKRLGVIWIDAHADLHSPFTSPSGNIHGMPLGAAINDDNLAHQVNDVTETTRSHWEAMKNVAVKGQKVLASDIVFFGVRDTEAAEEAQIEKYKIKNFSVAETRFKGISVCLEECFNILADCDHYYISFDVDSLDCDLVSYGTGTPVPKGFDHEEVIKLIKGLLASQKVSCLEMVEINPLLDNKGNKMAETAFEVLKSVTADISLV